MKHGDFTGLAENYELYRVGYSEDVLRAAAALLPSSREEASVLDVGAGTGKWTRMLAEYFGSCVAVEPNDDMRSQGEAASGSEITWKAGGAESLAEPDAAFDWVTMASSFHWTDYKTALSEFRRVLKPGGLFTCLWNPRKLEGQPLLEEIEAMVDAVVPRSSRKSSGSSSFVEQLCTRLTESGEFGDLIYMEAEFVVAMSPERYLGAWRSVNDIPAQAGPEKFEELMNQISDRISGLDKIECPYLTRAWTVRRT